MDSFCGKSCNRDVVIVCNSLKNPRGSISKDFVPGNGSKFRTNRQDTKVLNALNNLHLRKNLNVN